MSRDVNLYAACDKAIQGMDRENLEAFGRLKMSKWDEVNLIRTVGAMYRRMARKAKRRYYEVAFEAYLLGLWMCGISGKKAHKMAEKAITDDWIDEWLEETDFVTLYRFNSETERKAYRLAEALEVSEDRNLEIEKALRAWIRQLGQYAINFTDYAVIKAFTDAGVEYVRWVTMQDERVCVECRGYDGNVYKIDEVPPKHWNCRCHLSPATKEDFNSREAD